MQITINLKTIYVAMGMALYSAKCGNLAQMLLHRIRSIARTLKNSLRSRTLFPLEQLQWIFQLR